MRTKDGVGAQVALSLNNLAALLRKTGRQEEAEQLYRRALSIYEDDYGVDHPQVSPTAVVWPGSGQGPACAACQDWLLQSSSTPPSMGESASVAHYHQRHHVAQCRRVAALAMPLQCEGVVMSPKVMTHHLLSMRRLLTASWACKGPATFLTL